MDSNQFLFIDNAIAAADLIFFGEPVHSPDQVRNALNTATTFGEYSTVMYVISRKTKECGSVYYELRFKA